MVKAISITKRISPDSCLPRIGGASFLPLGLDWPINSNGEKLTLIFSLPASFINQYCDLKLADDKYISVFSTYNNGYFLDDVIDNGDIPNPEDIYLNFTRVIIHHLGDRCRNESYVELDSFLIETKEFNPNDIYSRIGGLPFFLQSSVKDADSMKFCFQFSCESLPNEISNILYLEDAVGYLFLNPYKEYGYYFGQCL